MRIRVLIIEDHPLMQEGLAAALSRDPGIEIVGRAGTGEDGIALAAEQRPDVTLLDMHLPDMGGIAILERLRQQQPTVRVLIVTASEHAETLLQAVAAGAAGYLSKDADRLEITDAILAVHRGDTVLAPAVQAGVAAEVRSRWRADVPSLSQRERQVLEMIAEGLSAPEIGRRLYLSPATIKRHLQNLYEKLGVSDRAAAVAEAMRRGLLE